jgi:hypothetical protein
VSAGFVSFNSIILFALADLGRRFCGELVVLFGCLCGFSLVWALSGSPGWVISCVCSVAGVMGWVILRLCWLLPVRWLCPLRGFLIVVCSGFAGDASAGLAAILGLVNYLLPVAGVVLVPVIPAWRRWLAHASQRRRLLLCRPGRQVVVVRWLSAASRHAACPCPRIIIQNAVENGHFVFDLLV